MAPRPLIDLIRNFYKFMKNNIDESVTAASLVGSIDAKILDRCTPYFSTTMKSFER